jgi:hypothetical protein
MTLNDPVVLWILGGVGAVVAWFARQLATRLEGRISGLEADIDALQVRMAAHDANRELLDRMYNELQALTKLTSRIAGHLNIS